MEEVVVAKIIASEFAFYFSFGLTVAVLLSIFSRVYEWIWICSMLCYTVQPKTVQNTHLAAAGFLELFLYRRLIVLNREWFQIFTFLWLVRFLSCFSVIYHRMPLYCYKVIMMTHNSRSLLNFKTETNTGVNNVQYFEKAVSCNNFRKINHARLETILFLEMSLFMNLMKLRLVYKRHYTIIIDVTLFFSDYIQHRNVWYILMIVQYSWWILQLLLKSLQPQVFLCVPYV